MKKLIPLIAVSLLCLGAEDGCDTNKLKTVIILGNQGEPVKTYTNCTGVFAGDSNIQFNTGGKHIQASAKYIIEDE